MANKSNNMPKIPVVTRSSFQRALREFSVSQKECFAAMIFEYFCRTNKVENPILRRFIDHLWERSKIDTHNDGVGVSWESYANWQNQLLQLPINFALSAQISVPSDIMDSVPTEIAKDFELSMRSIFETIYASWDVTDVKLLDRSLMQLLDIACRYGFQLSDFVFYCSEHPTLDWRGFKQTYS